MIDTNFSSILDLLKVFPDEQTCIKHLEELRWNGNVISPFDETSKIYKCKGNKYRCKNTGKYFNVKTNTLFDNTKIKLQKWFLAIYLVTSQKKSISSLQLSRDLGITQKTAWFMLQRLRNCFGISDNNQLDNEIDENFFGSKNKNRQTNRKVNNSQGRSLKGKTPVLEMIMRKGKLIAKEVANTINGIYYFTALKHLRMYVGEFAFRYNTRKISTPIIYNYMHCNFENRLTYKKLIYG